MATGRRAVANEDKKAVTNQERDSMKESKFNLYFNAPDGARIAFNSLSCGLAVVDENYERLLAALSADVIPEDLAEVCEAAKRGNFIVESDKDEVLDYETKRTAQKFSTQSFGLTLAPTLDCNFRCVYCYETRRKGKMSDETQSNIVKLVERRASEIKNFEVTWYGGEPLLCMDVISNLSGHFARICEQNHVQYHAFIITNGYLLTPQIAEDLKRFKISGAQITIDGPKEIHEKRRVNRNEMGSFERILDNVNMLISKGFEVIIRVNVDKSNERDVSELLEVLGRRLMSKKVKITFGQVSAYTEACKGMASSCFGNEDFAAKLLEYYKILDQHGFGETNKFPYPFAKLSYCCAEQLNSFVVDPDGMLYKCWNDVGNSGSSVGNVNDPAMDSANDKCGRWLCRKLPDRCRNCNILPICAGGCPHVTNVLHKPNACDFIRYNIEETMLEYYRRFSRNMR